MTKTTHSTSMNKNELEQNKYINTLYSIVDKLEQRIATLEKVLASHAKCLGEMREEDIKTWTTKNTSGDETIWVGRK